MPNQCRLRVLAHPSDARIGSYLDVDVEDVSSEPGQPDRTQCEMGRSSACQIELVAPSISRRHAAIRKHGDDWIIVDLGSRHGTFVNGVRLQAETPAVLRHGDEIQLGPVVLSAQLGGGSRAPLMTIAEAPPSAGTKASVVPASALGGLAQHRLDVLMRSAAAMAAAPNDLALAETVAIAAGRGTRAARALVLRPTGNAADFELIGSYRSGSSGSGSAGGKTDGGIEAMEAISNSVVEMALRGQMAQLMTDQMLTPGVAAPSIVGLGIRSAICAPVRVGEQVAAVLYLDARGVERQLEADTAGFCEALASFFGLALANLRRVEVERRQEELRRDLDAARGAQRQIMPEPEGRVGPVHYASISMPGRVVAGDLFDVIPVDEQRTIVMLGDVSGKGVGAAVMMATVQTYLRASAQHESDPALLLADVNRYACARFPVGKFITLWLGVVDAEASTLRYSDAGHGHWCLVLPESGPGHPVGDGGYPLGVEAIGDYPPHCVPFPVGSRLVLFSDGLIEQANADGTQFGMEGVLRVLGGSTSCEEDVRVLHDALAAHAGGDVFDDDLTIASAERRA